MDRASEDPWMTIFRFSAPTYNMIIFLKRWLRTQKCRATIIALKMPNKYGLQTGKGQVTGSICVGAVQIGSGCQWASFIHPITTCF